MAPFLLVCRWVYSLTISVIGHSASSLLHAHTHGLVHSAFLMSRAPDDGEEGGSKQTTHGKYDMLMACVASRRMVGITDEGQIEGTLVC